MRAVVLALPLSLACALLHADRADACGGLFCATASPSPVDQQAERVLFEVNDDLSVTATVEVKYQGDPSAFSWIIPVSATPSFIETGSASVFQLLDAATRPSFIAPQQDFSECDAPGMGPGGFACEERMLEMPVPPPSDQVPTSGGGVVVTEYPNVGPYTDIILVEGEDPSEIVSFLNDNGYLVTESMRPIFEEYSSEAQRFLAVQLQPSAEAKDIVPIRFHCPAPGPVIPLRLTQVAAAPEMGIVVFIAGAQRYRPALASGFSELLVPPEDVHIDNQGRNNYFPLISKLIDDLGGLGFVTQRAQPGAQVLPLLNNIFLGTEDEEAARTELTRLFTERPYLTRMYSRMSGHEMVVDPVFEPSEGGDVDGSIDLSGQTVQMCGDEGDTPPCGLLYCGNIDACATTELGDGCACNGSRTARASTAPDGTPTVSCVPTSYDFVGGVSMQGCDGVDCGEGVCFPQNGSATCRCAEGAAAVVDGNNPALVRCVAAIMAYGPEQLTWPVQPGAPATQQACSGNRGRAGGLLSLALLFGSALALRVRRRRH
ncbi:MAG: DUF2330 domain-containing protein [Deltaproteobacteria bacterium]|nr:DUF2330 domain-containing protein [Deltaproteobacteria bacterium]